MCFDSEQTSETSIPEPTPEELYSRRIFMNSIAPNLMQLAGFDVTKRDTPQFLGYMSTDKQNKYMEGKIGAWTGDATGSQKDYAQNYAQNKIKEQGIANPNQSDWEQYFAEGSKKWQEAQGTPTYEELYNQFGTPAQGGKS